MAGYVIRFQQPFTLFNMRLGATLDSASIPVQALPGKELIQESASELF
jgi:hypothetical protein